ncbi:MAG: HEAT repeat domain-containing protein [Saprospiraceae bacterium]|nr:HEAT repeat domain-containing protein [Saprospiraceae bacterium]MCB9321211.1 HEAT repeat domain-containing protein [Lewinellaceae bacterium]
MKVCFSISRLALAGFAFWILSCNTPQEAPPTSQEEIISKQLTADSAKAIASRIQSSLALEIADGLQFTLWASDSLAPDPIAMTMDDQGTLYLTRTNRQKHSEFDIRGHQDWMTASIRMQSVEDRRAFLHETFAPEKSEQNAWLEDLNHDSIHDWRDLAVERDEVWRLEDRDQDGLADVSTRVVNDFHEEVTDVMNAVLYYDKDLFVGIGPDLWKLEDTDGDGIPDKKTSLSHGFNVHIGFGGHGMSGLIVGPDGKIYWGIGDPGANITAPDGKHYMYPNQGVIVRCNPDGSDFEVVAHGLRNTHEFVFDAYGNLISSDNDGDHRGESERLVHLIDGSDSGWRINWQFGKYTDPKNNGYKVWMDEKMFTPHWDGQAAYFLPPIQNYHNGPTGMLFNPGTALGKAWQNKFFLVEFTGTPARSPIWSFSLKPKGASFELAEEQAIVRGILPTDIQFGPDGAMYVADWINGWDTKNYGRVWKLDVTPETDDLKAERAETAQLMRLDYAAQEDARLLELLGNGDMRIRMKAQFALAAKGNGSAAIFKQATDQTTNQLERVHGIWGIGQLARKDATQAQALLPLLQDADAEIATQAIDVLGDIRYKEAAAQIIPFLTHESPRVRMKAAQALGRMQVADATEPILAMLEANNDQDLWLRHAGMIALARIGDADKLAGLTGNPSVAVRTAAVVALRQMQSPKVAGFLADKDEFVVAEAARAINDDWSIPDAMPALAAILNTTKFHSEALLRRSMNACLRVGQKEQVDELIHFATRNDVTAAMRAEALHILASWSEPSVLDRVDGRYRGEMKHDAAPAVAAVQPHLEDLFKSKDPEVLIAASQVVSGLSLSSFEDKLKDLQGGSKNAEVRSAMLTALAALKVPDMEALVQKGMADKDAGVRSTAVGLLSQLDIAKEKLPGIVDPIFSLGSTREQQAVLRALADMPADKTTPVLSTLMNKLKNDKLSKEVQLDLFEAVEKNGNQALTAQVEAMHANQEDPLAAYAEALYGGDRRAGWWLFNTNPTAQCVRCHAINGQGGEVGPDLTAIGAKLTREQILQALVDPSARIAPGYGVVSLTLSDGQTVTGILMEETPKELTLKTSAAEPLEVEVSRITKRDNMPSSMPNQGLLLNKREIRNLVEFLVNQKGDAM